MLRTHHSLENRDEDDFFFSFFLVMEHWWNEIVLLSLEYDVM